MRERAGQLAHAKAEYEEYLRRYPDGAAAARVRAACWPSHRGADPQTTGELAATAAGATGQAGSGSVTYQYGQEQISTGGTTSRSTSLNAVLVYGDLLVRNRGPRYEFTARADSRLHREPGAEHRRQPGSDHGGLRRAD